MDRRSKEIAGLAISAIALITLTVLMFSMLSVNSGYSMFVGVVMIILAVVALSGLLVGITFSRSGWEVGGSTLEWLLAAAISPFTTLMFYLASTRGKGDDEDAIDPIDRQRLDHL